MVYTERTTWSSLVASVIGVIIYAVIVFGQLGTRPVDQIDWLTPMLWTIGGAIVGAIVINILWGIFAGMRDPEGALTSDQRDRDIERMGDRVGQAFLVLGGLGALALCAIEADWFWIANTVFFGFAVSAVVGGTARVIAYRRGLV